jgi:MFS family permease
MFFSAASIAGAFSGLLAFAISKMDGVGGLEGWRWIFILEGIATVLVAFIAFFTLFDFPETASFLTEEERAFVVFRLKYGQDKEAAAEGRVQVAEVDNFEWKYVWQAFTDWHIWANLFVYWGVSPKPIFRQVTTSPCLLILTRYLRSSALSTVLVSSCQPSSTVLGTPLRQPSFSPSLSTSRQRSWPCCSLSYRIAWGNVAHSSSSSCV